MEGVKVLLEWFGELIQAPADVEKLNTAVLQWAVQGRLVEQDPNDESAVVLFERITTAKQVSSAEKKNKKENPLPINDAESLHELPLNWQWVSLRQIGELNPRNQAQDDLKVSFIPMRCISEKYGDPLQTETRAWREIKSGYTHVQENDVVLAKITPCFENGKSVVMEGLANGIGAGTTELHVFRSNPSFIVPHYVLLFFKSPRFMSVGQTQMTGTAGQKRLPGNYVANAPFPLPPYEEQKRIVAKVEAVLGQTRVLAGQMGEVEEKRKTTRQAALRRLVTAVSQTEVATAWAFIAQHFHDLYTEPEAVQELKQAILQLAVQGRLVPQDPNDEETAVLLEQIAAEKDKLIKAKKIAKTDNLPPIILENMPKIPSYWGWIRLGHLLYGIKAGHSPTAQDRPARNGEFGVLKVSAVTWGKFNPHENKALLSDALIEDIPTAKADDLLISRANTAELVGAVVLVEQDYPYLLLSDKTLRLDFVPNSVYKPFMLLALRAFWIRNLFAEQATGTSSSMRNISQEKIRLAPIAMPPLAEQKRIVAKVNELFSLCDQLAGEIALARQKREQALGVILARAV